MREPLTSEEFNDFFSALANKIEDDFPVVINSYEIGFLIVLVNNELVNHRKAGAIYSPMATFLDKLIAAVNEGHKQ